MRLVHVNWCREPGDSAVDNPMWDTHAQNADRLEDVLCPMFDTGFTALIEDLGVTRPARARHSWSRSASSAARPRSMARAGAITGDTSSASHSRGPASARARFTDRATAMVRFPPATRSRRAT